MSLHDAYARMTPFEIAFPDERRLRALAASVAEEAAERGADASVPDTFLALAAVGSFLAELHGPDVPRVALLEYGMLTFHAVHFVSAGSQLFLLETETSRSLVGAAPPGEPVPPSPAGYVQLPQHLFWTVGPGSGSPESLDGMFWTMSTEGRLFALPISGVRPDRPGFGALPLPDAPLAHAGLWMRESAREGGDDFRSTLPGADLDGLYAVETAGELLKLLARFFAHAEALPTALERTGPATAPAHGPRPSALGFVRVRLAA